MTSAGTLISDLDGKGPSGNDDDLVRQIMNDINSNGNNTMMPQQSMGQPPMGLPPPQLNSYKIQQPNANAIYTQSADPAVPTAHMIGREHPNPADFAQMMSNQAYGQGYPYMQQQQPIPAPVHQEKSQWKEKLFEQMRQPILVALIVFVLSLPAVNVLFSYYAPNLLRSGGDLNNFGLLARASIAGLTFWTFQNVIAPLMN